MNETPSPRVITVEGGEGIHVHAQAESQAEVQQLRADHARLRRLEPAELIIDAQTPPPVRAASE